MWKKETIPVESLLYFFVHFQFIRYDKKGVNPVVSESAFTNTPKDGPNKSCDWNKYNSPDETRNLRGKEYKTGKTEFKNPFHFFVYSNIVKDWRSLESPLTPQKVEHDPIYQYPEIIGTPNNRAHSIIIGPKNEMLRVIMARLVQWEIKPPETKSDYQDYIQKHTK